MLENAPRKAVWRLAITTGMKPELFALPTSVFFLATIFSCVSVVITCMFLNIMRSTYAQGEVQPQQGQAKDQDAARWGGATNPIREFFHRLLYENTV